MNNADESLLARFKKERTLIGGGMVSDVYLWNGYAYKCYKDFAPEHWLEQENAIQEKIFKTGLPVIEYHPSEFDRSLKMDYIKGITLADRVRKENYKLWLGDLMTLSDEIHSKHGLDLESIVNMAHRDIPNITLDDSIKEKALRYLDELGDGDSLLHIDFHFLNVMWTGEKYYIIDWISALIGNPIHDFARSYVVMSVFAKRFSGIYFREVLKRYSYTESDFRKAIFVAAVLWYVNNKSSKVNALIDDLDY